MPLKVIFELLNMAHGPVKAFFGGMASLVPHAVWIIYFLNSYSLKSPLTRCHVSRI